MNWQIMKAIHMDYSTAGRPSKKDQLAKGRLEVSVKWKVKITGEMWACLQEAQVWSTKANPWSPG